MLVGSVCSTAEPLAELFGRWMVLVAAASVAESVDSFAYWAKLQCSNLTLEYRQRFP